MYTATLELVDTDNAHLLNTKEPMDVHLTTLPSRGDSFRFFVQDAPWVTSEVLLVEHRLEDDCEVRFIHTVNSTYKLTDLDGDEYEDDLFIEFEFDDDDEL
jgi:hypothetical protein